MSRLKSSSHPALLVEVLAELGAGRIYERFIHDKHFFVHGETNGHSITINPSIAIADTVIHECLHRLRPNWSEPYIRRTTTWLLRRLSDTQIQQVYEEYQKRSKKRRVRGARRHHSKTQWGDHP